MKRRKVTFGRFLEYIIIGLVVVNIGLALTMESVSYETVSNEPAEYSENCDTNCYLERTEELLKDQD